jgi:hypothetical protein
MGGRRSISGVALYCQPGTSTPICAYADESGVLQCTRFDWQRTVGYFWTENQQMAGNMSDATPSLIVQDGVLTCMHRGYRDTQLKCCYMDANGFWQPDIDISNCQSDSGPGSVISGGVLSVVFRDIKGSDLLLVADRPSATASWSTLYQPAKTNQEPIYSGSTPSLLTYEGDAYCVHSGGDGDSCIWTLVFRHESSGLRYYRFDRSFNYHTEDGPTLVALDDQLYVFYRSMDDDAWTMFAKFHKNDDWSQVYWSDERHVGNAEPWHQGWYEIGVCSFPYDSDRANG